MGWWAQTRSRPLGGWILAGELICAAGFALNVVVVFAFFRYARGLDFGEIQEMALGGLPWWALLGSVLAGLMLWGGALGLVIAYVARGRIEKRVAAAGRTLR